jgi:ATP-dependent Clp protease ATP-binding subunit ClpC
VFERLTEQARIVVVQAQEEARALRHNYIGTEHLLLGLLRGGEGVAAQVLESFDVTLEAARARVGQIVGQGDDRSAGKIPFTPRAKKVLELSLREAKSLGHTYIATEHLLLGLVRENNGVAISILLEFDADAAKVREAVHRVIGVETRGGDSESSTEYGPSGRFQRGAREIAFLFGRMPRGTLDYTTVPRVPPLLLGWLLFVGSLAIGILVGWLIWA